MANRRKENKYIGAAIGGAIGGVLGVALGPAGVAFVGGFGAWAGHAIEKWLNENG
jgi:outer membrane lipoprotein SlyB